MTDLSYSHGMLARNWLRWHGLGYLPKRETMTEIDTTDPIGVIYSAQGTDLINVTLADGTNVAVSIYARNDAPALIAPSDARELAAILTEAADCAEPEN